MNAKEEQELVDNFYESLHMNYPKMMQRSSLRGLEIHAGWLFLIDALCKQLYSSYERAEAHVAHHLKYTGSNADPTALKKLEELMEYEESHLPVLLQIKEKFGGLRIYATVFKDSQSECISLTEEIASVTCEDCGARGTLRSGNWLRTLCDTHNTESDASD